MLDWDRPISPPRKQAKQLNRARKAPRVILWVNAHPAIVLSSLGGAVLTVFSVVLKAQVAEGVLDR